MPQSQKFKNAELPQTACHEPERQRLLLPTRGKRPGPNWMPTHVISQKPSQDWSLVKICLVNQAINRYQGWANAFEIVYLFSDISKLFCFCVSCDRELLVKMATDSDQESEVSFATNSTVDEDVAWPSNSAARAPEQISLEHGDQKDFEKFVKKKHEQVSRRLICKKSCSLTRETVFFQIKKDQESVRGVIYLGHVPHGFAEEPLRKFFSQFGKITRLKLSRSKKVREILRGRCTGTVLISGYIFLDFFRRAEARATDSSSLSTVKSRKSPRTLWIITWCMRNCSNVSFCFRYGDLSHDTEHNLRLSSPLAVTDRSIDWLAKLYWYRSIDWSIDWLAKLYWYRSIDWLIGWINPVLFIDWLMYHFSYWNDVIFSFQILYFIDISDGDRNEL